MAETKDRAAWAHDIVAALGMTPTPWRIEFFTEWARYEGTTAENNPLASTRKTGLEKGKDWTPFNSNQGNPVCNYASEETGLRMTVESLRLSYYTAILAAVKAQVIRDRKTVADEVYKPGHASWGTVGFAHLIRGGWSPSAPRILQGEAPEGTDVVIGKPAPRVDTGGTARKAARDTAVGAPAIGALLAAALATDWSGIRTEFAAEHIPAAIGLFLATPFALAIWRVIREWTREKE